MHALEDSDQPSVSKERLSPNVLKSLSELENVKNKRQNKDVKACMQLLKGKLLDVIFGYVFIEEDSNFDTGYII